MRRVYRQCIVFIVLFASMLAGSPQAQGHTGTLYLTIVYTEYTENGYIPLQVDGRAVHLLYDKYRSGDKYNFAARDIGGYVLRGELSTPLSGVFDTEDVEIILCYERRSTPTRVPSAVRKEPQPADSLQTAALLLAN